MKNKYKASKGSLEKFTRDGQVKRYEGNTIISFLNEPDNPIYQLAVKVQEILSAKEYGHKFYSLPEDSFHMTTIGLINDSYRGSELWPNYLSADAEMEEVDRAVYERIKKVDFPDSFEMELQEITLVNFKLKPVNDEIFNKLNDFRSEISEALEVPGLYDPNYQFHSTHSYLIDDLEEDEITDLEKTLKDLNEEHLAKDIKVHVPRPVFTVFNDMLAFHEDLGER